MSGSAGTAAPARRPTADLVLSAGLFLLCAFVYAQVRAFSFVEIDDPHFTTGNPMVRDGLSWRGLAWAFGTFQTGNWHPLTWVSHQLDTTLFEAWAGGHHLTNVALHAANALLLFAALRRLTGARWRSAAVAALFAAHPLHVESVAWVAERKDVLAALFFLLALRIYPGALARGPRRLAAPAACLALGLLAKPTVVTLPLALLILDRWPLGRGHDGTGRARLLLTEKAPLLLLSGAGALAAILAQRSEGALQPLAVFSPGARVGNAAVSAVAYLAKTLLPRNLAVFYPHPGEDQSVALALAAAGVLALVSAVAWRQRRRAPYLLAGWSWYLVTVTPMIGLVQVGDQALADRYTYLPLIGVFVVIVWGAADLAGAGRGRRRAAGAALAAAILMLAVLARSQAAVWRDSVRLFTHAREAIGIDEPRVLLSLAIALELEGRREEALEALRRHAALTPSDAAAQNRLGGALLVSGRPQEALAALAAAVRLSPGTVAYHADYGMALTRLGRKREAEEQFRAAMRAKPGDAELHNRLGCVLAEQGREEAAEREFRAALRIEPAHAAAAENLGRLGRRRGN